jgi:hypothetical protein
MGRDEVGYEFFFSFVCSHFAFRKASNFHYREKKDETNTVETGKSGKGHASLLQAKTTLCSKFS